MTSADEMTAACEALEAQGQRVSGNLLVQYFHARGRPLSKRTALHYLKQRPGYAPAPVRAARTQPPHARPPAPPVAEAPVPTPVLMADDDPVFHAPAPPAPPPPRPLDPVDLARAALEQAQQQLENAREWMDTACLAFMVSDGLVRNGLRYGGYARDDPARIAVEQTARQAMGEYHEAWQAVVQAQQALAQADRLHRRGHQEQWVATHQPGLAQDLADWRERLRTAASDRYHAEAKKNLALALQAYEQAVALAPYSPNGSHP
jgi:hypothetical protein